MDVLKAINSVVLVELVCKLSFLYTLWGLSVCWGPFLPLWESRELGFSAAQVGQMQAAISVSLLVCAPLFCMVLDVLGTRRGELFAAAVMVARAALHASYLLLPAIGLGTPLRAIAVIGIVLVAETLRGAGNGVLDVMCLAKLGSARLEYGKIRLWTSLMWGAGAVVIGWVQPEPLSSIFLLSTFFSAALIAYYAAALSTPRHLAEALPPTTAPLAAVGAEAKPSYWEQLRDFAVQSEWVIWREKSLSELLLLFLVLGTARRAFETFVFLLVDTLPGGSTSLMGLATLIQTVSELPAYWYFKFLSVKIGTRGVLYVTAACYIIRALVYSQVTVAWPVLLIEPLHGLTFALLFSNVVVIAAEVAPPGLEGTAQGVLARGVFEGLGGLAGSVVGGLLFDRSPGLLFGSLVVLVSAMVCIMLAADAVRSRARAKPKASLAEPLLR